MALSPLDSTGLLTVFPMTFIRNWERSSEHSSLRFIRRELCTRLIGISTVLAAQAIDLVGNILLLVLKSPIVLLQKLKIVNWGIEFTPESQLEHLKKIGRTALGFFVGIPLILSNPDKAGKFLCPPCSERWMWAKDAIGLNRLFDRGGYITLEHCHDRQSDMESHLSTCQISMVEKFLGVNGQDNQAVYRALLELEVIQPLADASESSIANAIKPFWSKFGNAIHPENRKRGRMGCFLAQLVFFKRMLESGAERIILLEDDSRFLVTSKEAIDHVVEELPRDWDVLYLGYHNQPGTQNKAIKDKLHITRGFGLRGTYSMIFKRAALEKIYSMMRGHLIHSKSKTLAADQFFMKLQMGRDVSGRVEKDLDQPMHFYATHQPVTSPLGYDSHIDFMHRPNLLCF